MKKQILILALSIFMLIYFIPAVKAQSFTKGLHIGIKSGVSKFLGESNADISGRINEFESSFGPAIDIEIAKYFISHLELGIEGGYSNLRGETYDPQFSAEGNHGSMSPSIDYPVEYENKLLYYKLIASYFLRNTSNEGERIYLNPYVRAGIGILNYRGTVQYIDPAHGGIIFGKGIGDYAEWSMSTAVYTGAAGIKASINAQLSIVATATFNYANYDFLDVVHNYTPEGERLLAGGIYAEFKLGLIYSFGNRSGGSKNKSSKKGGHGSGRSSTNLPFSRQ